MTSQVRIIFGFIFGIAVLTVMMNSTFTPAPQAPAATMRPQADPVRPPPMTPTPATPEPVPITPEPVPVTPVPATPEPVPATPEPTPVPPVVTNPKLKDLQLVAFYYAWYHKSKDQHQGWSRHGRNEDPLLGHYESTDPKILSQHIDWATAYGIDAFCISTIGLPDKLLDVPNIHKIKIIPLIEYWSVFEAPHIYNLNETANQETMNHYLKKLTPLLTHPSAMKIDGKVVVYFYLTRLMKHFDENAKEVIGRGLPVEIFWVADEVFFDHSQISPRLAPNALATRPKPVFDSYTGYNMYTTPPMFRHEETRHAGMQVLEYFEKYMQPIYYSWAKDTRFFPGVMSRYRDFRPENPPLWGNPEDFRKILQGAAAMPRGPQAGGTHLMFLTTWNEWFEGTSLEPSEQWGFRFLEVLREELKPHLPAPGHTMEEIRNPKDKASAWWLEYRDFMVEQYSERQPTAYPQPTIEMERSLWDNIHVRGGFWRQWDKQCEKGCYLDVATQVCDCPKA